MAKQTIMKFPMNPIQSCMGLESGMVATQKMGGGGGGGGDMHLTIGI